ncbi:pentafunctional arom polypeptide [Moniliophthora roreri MCA 2997]|uniref:Pentafunctional arom polypeptide n=1 Tax=Moniliophthora roreri (strain MCA 2997) TaxID=1381753 RepID=V2X3J0_MONRO|nr:pentafunctional arom polypeptide [Moniliophthora roreri MCA 2997]
MVNTTDSGKMFRLYGFPILHSASPAFQNAIFDAKGEGKRYSTFSTSKVTTGMMEELRSNAFGGASVTMPIKASIIPYLDGIEPESEATGAVNTIVKVPSPTGYRLIGTNTDILGVKNALLRSLRLQHPGRTISPEDKYPLGIGAGIVYGGGATTRSSVYALTSLGLHPIYLVNRDETEVKQVQEAFPELAARGSLKHLQDPEQVEKTLVQSNSPPVLMVVGAIPAITPLTKAERMVYTTASHIFTVPYTTPDTYEISSEPGTLPLPTKRLFLEMAYKPRLTPMLKVAAAHGWEPIDGTKAMIEQGYAAQRMWATGNASSVIGSDPTILGPEIEQQARELIDNMTDIIVKEVEVDKAANSQAAPIPH